MAKGYKADRLIQEQEYLENAKLNALTQAALQGWTDIAAGLYTDVDAVQLNDFIAQLGRHPDNSR